MIKRFLPWVRSIMLVLIMSSLAGCAQTGPTPEKIPLRLAVALTPQELETFQVQLDSIRVEHPEWDIILETTPQSALVEKITTQLASGTLPDVMRIPGLFAQQWIRREAFLDLTALINQSEIDPADFYPSPLEQFRWQDKFWGLPDTGAPGLIFYNKDMFDAANLSYPDEDWTFEEMRLAAVQLTLDNAGNNPLNPAFDPNDIQQWGWNSGISNIWQREKFGLFGGDPCVNPDCTSMNISTPEIIQAVDWWASLVQEDHAAPYDPFSGSQTGIPGDPLISGKAAMGLAGYFAIGQLESSAEFRVGITEPFVNMAGERRTPSSTNGYVISSNTAYPQEAWALMTALLEADFLIETWGEPGHSVPALRAAAATAFDPNLSTETRQVILRSVEYSEVFKPYTASAFEVHARTTDLFIQMMKGDLAVKQGLQQIEEIANETLEADR